MTIASEITRIKTNIDNAYTALEAKGATIPSEKNSANLADTIDTITTGSNEAFTGREVSSTGVFQMTSEPIEFSLPDSATSIDDYTLRNAFNYCDGLTSVDLASVTKIGNYGLQDAFANCTNLASVDLNNVATVGISGLDSTFQNCSSLGYLDLGKIVTASSTSCLSYVVSGCTNLVSADLHSLTNIGWSSLEGAFNRCSSLTSINLNNLKTVGDSSLKNAFSYCTSLTSLDLSSVKSVGSYGLQNAFQFSTSLYSVDLSGLQTVGQNGLDTAFYNTGLTSITFNNLSSIGISGFRLAFYSCKQLTSVSFPSLNSGSFTYYTNQFNQMLLSTTGVTVHFPSNLESVIGDWEDVTKNFNGTNVTISFDLPATT